MKKILFVFGTRPEAIKLAPVITAFKKDSRFKTYAASTGQHREMLNQMLQSFGLRPDYDLNIMAAHQTLFDVTANVLRKLEKLYRETRPDMVMAQGDTTTAFCATLGAFYLKIPVAHVEAGLRSFDLENPFPEEANRIFIDRLASLYFSATPLARKNLLKEGVPPKKIFVTGNTVIDALRQMSAKKHEFKEPTLRRFFSSLMNERERAQDPSLPRSLAPSLHRIILLTAHRRENFGAPLKAICRAVLDLVRKFPEVRVVYPVHLNPNVQETAYKMLAGHNRILLTQPMDYLDLVQVMQRSYLILTDSGGIQEEAPSFGKPVLILRKVTERSEAVKAGCARLIGELTAPRIFSEASRLLSNPGLYRRMAKVRNPFGDGQASERILAATRFYFGLRKNRPPEW